MLLYAYGSIASLDVRVVREKTVRMRSEFHSTHVCAKICKYSSLMVTANTVQILQPGPV
jgi:hypothetical protein